MGWGSNGQLVQGLGAAGRAKRTNGPAPDSVINYREDGDLPCRIDYVLLNLDNYSNLSEWMMVLRLLIRKVTMKVVCFINYSC